MAFPKGKKKDKKTGGRKKGTPNKLTQTVKDTVLNVFNNLQEDPKAKLEAWAKREPGEFYKIASKLIPAEVNSTVKIKKVGIDLEEETKLID